MSFERVLREGPLDKRSDDSWLGYRPWQSRYFALYQNRIDIRESQQIAGDDAESISIASVTDVLAVENEPAQFKLVLGSSRTLELRSEIDEAADDVRMWSQAIKLQIKLIQTSSVTKTGATPAQIAAVRSARLTAESDINNRSAHKNRKEDDPVQIQQQIRAVTHDSKTSLQNAIRSAVDANQVGASTVQQLAMQQEQLARVQNDVDEMDGNLSRTEWILKGMKSWSGAVSNFFSSGPDAPQSQSTASSISTAEAMAKSNAAVTAAASVSISTKPSRSVVGKVQTPDDVQEIKDEHDNEINRDLDQLSGLLKNMHGLAETMNVQLNTQNNQLNQLNSSVDKVSGKMQSQNITMKKIVS